VELVRIAEIDGDTPLPGFAISLSACADPPVTEPAGMIRPSIPHIVFAYLYVTNS
jgi:hypothetical protein